MNYTTTSHTKSLSDGEKIKEEYFNLCMHDIKDGLSLLDLRFMLDDHAEKELYWECAGIKKAIDFITFRLVFELTKADSKQFDNLNINYADTKKKSK